MVGMIGKRLSLNLERRSRWRHRSKRRGLRPSACVAAPFCVSYAFTVGLDSSESRGPRDLRQGMM